MSEYPICTDHWFSALSANYAWVFWSESTDPDRKLESLTLPRLWLVFGALSGQAIA